MSWGHDGTCEIYTGCTPSKTPPTHPPPPLPLTHRSYCDRCDKLTVSAISNKWLHLRHMTCSDTYC